MLFLCHLYDLDFNFVLLNQATSFDALCYMRYMYVFLLQKIYKLIYPANFQMIDIKENLTLNKSPLDKSGKSFIVIILSL